MLLQNPALTALPNVLHDQTVPNRLGGVGAPGPEGRRVPVVRPVAAAGVILVTGLVVLLALVARAA